MAVDILSGREGFFDPRAVAYRVGHFVSGIMSSPQLGEQLSQATAQRQHDDEAAIGRLLALTVLDRRERGLPMHMYDRDGNVVGNLWTEFQRIPEGVPYEDMKLTDDQISALEAKANPELLIE